MFRKTVSLYEKKKKKPHGEKKKMLDKPLADNLEFE